MKIDQVAYYCATPHEANEIKIDLDLKDESAWIKDTVTAKSRVRKGNKIINCINVAELQFNYSLGIELEIIRYIKGDHWHPEPLFRKSISHIGVHLEDGEAFPVLPHSQLVQETKTISHTSEYLTDPKSPGYKRLYHYRIFEMAPGNYIKYIRRIHASK